MINLKCILCQSVSSTDTYPAWHMACVPRLPLYAGEQNNVNRWRDANYMTLCIKSKPRYDREEKRLQHYGNMLTKPECKIKTQPQSRGIGVKTNPNYVDSPCLLMSMQYRF